MAGRCLIVICQLLAELSALQQRETQTFLRGAFFVMHNRFFNRIIYGAADLSVAEPFGFSGQYLKRERFRYETAQTRAN